MKNWHLILSLSSIALSSAVIVQPAHAQGTAITGVQLQPTDKGFRQVFGTTVFGCLHHYRLEQARFLLTETSLSVAQVARKVGYSNLSAFSTAFRKKYGINPRTDARSANLVKFLIVRMKWSEFLRLFIIKPPLLGKLLLATLTGMLKEGFYVD